ncbi:hypothetical protein KSP39_PZI016987 [Platanthera zijinensis]|uniref:DUF4283 domain-containing protein n=1 Tax=Platanthera zijinensis TaxID=2320716 RepID=A0AAP0G0A7_9ASPA
MGVRAAVSVWDWAALTSCCHSGRCSSVVLAGSAAISSSLFSIGKKKKASFVPAKKSPEKSVLDGSSMADSVASADDVASVNGSSSCADSAESPSLELNNNVNLELVGNFKNNDGILDLDEDEAAIFGAEFDNALVGRILWKNFKFEWLASQLQARWGAYPSFRINDLGNWCFILFFADKASRDRVWLGGPWHVAGFTVGLDKWTKNSIPSKNPQM